MLNLDEDLRVVENVTDKKNESLMTQQECNVCHKQISEFEGLNLEISNNNRLLKKKIQI